MNIATMNAFPLSLGRDKRICRNFVKCGDYRHCVYFIEIDGVIVYVGKCRDLWKRLDTYRNSKYWKEANPSNILKTCRLEMAIKKKKVVRLLVSTHSEIDYHDYEIEMIRTLKPEWNKHQYEKSIKQPV